MFRCFLKEKKTQKTISKLNKPKYLFPKRLNGVFILLLTIIGDNKVVKKNNFETISIYFTTVQLAKSLDCVYVVK